MGRALCAVLLTWAAGAWAARPRVVVVQSSDLAPYHQAAAGFIAEVDADVRVLTLGSSADAAAALWQQVAKLEPALVFAVGPTSANGAKRGLGSVPVIFGLVPYYERYGLEGPRVTGVALGGEVGTQLDALLAVMPRVKRLGILHDPRYSTAAVEAVRGAAKGRGLSVVALETDSGPGAERALKNARGRVDALLLLADRTVASSSVIQAEVAFADAEKIALVALAPSQVREGALLSLTPSYLGMGQQAGRLANRILHERVDPSALAVSVPEQLELSLSLKALRRLSGVAALPMDVLQFSARQGYALRVFE